MRDLAERMIAWDMRQENLTGTSPPTVSLVCEKLRPELTTLMGSTGFRALLARALRLAGSNVAWLQALQVNADGTVGGLQERNAQVTSDEFLEGNVAMLVQLLGLLVAFIGENLTSRIIRDRWPKLALKGVNPGKRTRK